MRQGLLLLALVGACNGPGDSPRSLVAGAEAAAKAGDARAFMELFHPHVRAMASAELGFSSSLILRRAELEFGQAREALGAGAVFERVAVPGDRAAVWGDEQARLEYPCAATTCGIELVRYQGTWYIVDLDMDLSGDGAQAVQAEAAARADQANERALRMH